MPGYSFSVTMTITNSTNVEQVVSIPRGTIIEPNQSNLAFQSAVIAKDYIFKLNPKETRSVILEAECWNQHLTPPKGTPGKLTPLRGKIGKTTNVWGTSSTPPQSTVSTKPSQDASVFSAFANTSPSLAYVFLQDSLTSAASRGIDVTDSMKQLNPLSSSLISSNQLCNIAKRPELAAYISASKIREFFIKQGSPSDNHIEAIENIVINVYALTSHILAARLHAVAMELSDLCQDRQVAVADEKRQELTLLIRQKYASLLDSLPLLDDIQW